MVQGMQPIVTTKNGRTIANRVHRQYEEERPGGRCWFLNLTVERRIS